MVEDLVVTDHLVPKGASHCRDIHISVRRGRYLGVPRRCSGSPGRRRCAAAGTGGFKGAAKATAATMAAAAMAMRGDSGTEAMFTTTSRPHQSTPTLAVAGNSQHKLNILRVNLSMNDTYITMKLL